MTIENANRLAELRRTHGYSQEELAEKLGISRQAVSKWERAESAPDTDNLIALSRLYGVTLDELLGLKVPVRPEAPAAEADAIEIPPEPLDADSTSDGTAGSAGSNDSTASSAGFNGNAESSDAPFRSDDDDFDSYYEHEAEKAAREREHRRRRFPYPVVVTVAYLALGFCFHLWHPGWIVFLTIPLFYLPDHARTPLRLLGNPVMVTIIYLLLGTQCGWWHPGWLVFFLIPLLNAADRGGK